MVIGRLLMERIGIFLIGILILFSSVSGHFLVRADDPDPPLEEMIWERSYSGPIYTDSYYESASTVYNVNGTDIEVGHADGNGNYYITDYYVLRNQTLIIEPGVNVISIGPEFINRTTGEINVKYPVNHMKVAGSLKAIGTDLEPISFCRDSHVLDGFSIDQTEYESRIEFHHCHFSNIDIYSTSFLFIDNCDFQNWSGIHAPLTHHYEVRGPSEIHNSIFEHHCRFFLDERQKVTIENNLFVGDESGFAVADSEMTILENVCEGGNIYLTNEENRDHEVTDNLFNHSYISLSGFLLIERNLFNGTLFSFDCEYGTIDLKYNNISNSNLKYYDWIGSDANFNFTMNYWGTVDEQKISSVLKVDEYDVEYLPFLDEEMNVFHEQKEIDDDGGNEKIITIIIFLMILFGIIMCVLIVSFFIIKRK